MDVIRLQFSKRVEPDRLDNLAELVAGYLYEIVGEELPFTVEADWEEPVPEMRQGPGGTWEVWRGE